MLQLFFPHRENVYCKLYNNQVKDHKSKDALSNLIVIKHALLLRSKLAH